MAGFKLPTQDHPARELLGDMASLAVTLDPRNMGKLPTTMEAKRQAAAHYDACRTSGSVQVVRLALNMDQIREVDPPPNPAKVTDSRAKDYIARYGEESWELDALSPAYLGRLIKLPGLKGEIYMQDPVYVRAFGRELEVDRSYAADCRTESRIVRAIVTDAIRAGMQVSVYDGQDVTVRLSSKVDEVMRALRTVDEEHLLMYRDGRRVGSVFLVYGNDGYDVVNDYSLSLEPIMARANALADELA